MNKYCIGDKNEDDLIKLKCLPFYKDDSDFTYKLNIITNLSCFVCENFEVEKTGDY